MLSLKTISLLKGTLKDPHAALTLPKKVIKHIPQVLKTDSSHIIVKHFNNGVLTRLSRSDDFDYVDDRVNAGSWWDNFWRWVWDLIDSIVVRQTPSSPNLKYVFAVVILILIIVVIIKFMRNNGINVLGGPSQRIGYADINILDDIHGISFKDEIDKAVSENNYRLAVRLHYLQTLKQLNDAGLISWKAGKTNAVYINELTDPAQKGSFINITRQFEYVWYGGFFIDSDSFKSIDHLFNNFKRTL